MAQDVLDVKLSELRDVFDRLELRIRLSETVGHDRLQQDIEALRRECGETERNMQSELLSSRAALAVILASAYGRMHETAKWVETELKERAESRVGADVGAVETAEEKILLAEYALDFAVQTANRALLLALEAIDSQLAMQEKER